MQLAHTLDAGASALMARNSSTDNDSLCCSSPEHVSGIGGDPVADSEPALESSVDSSIKCSDAA